MNYQYRAFGVPGLGFKRGLEQDLVVAPYAAILALPYAKRQGLKNLRKMKELGAHGKYGFYEAIDFTSERMPKIRATWSYAVLWHTIRV
nr:glucoamylase family protein [Paenibacillus larvae]